MTVISPGAQARFWAKVAKSDSPDDCWLWTAAKSGNGYGNYRVQALSAHMPAHRVSYWIASGEYPDEGLVIRHKCDTPLCVNPNHLEIGTQSDNMRDAYKRGRR